MFGFFIMYAFQNLIPVYMILKSSYNTFILTFERILS